MPTLGPIELVVILVIVTMLFGVGKLPEVFGAVGKGIREFRRNSTVEAEKAAKEAETKEAETSSEPIQASESTAETKTSEPQQVS
ncbi:MAG: twin-arginine translocase TatA/TatE family subunit [Litorilinea sp.]